MAILVTADVPEVTAAMDAAMVGALGLEANPPKGSRCRIAGPGPNGWRILSVWDSRDEFDAFLKDRLAPGLAKVGRSVPEFQYWTVESVIIPST